MSAFETPPPEQLRTLCRRWKIRKLSLFGRPIDLVRERNITNPYRLASIRRDRRPLYAA